MNRLFSTLRVFIVAVLFISALPAFAASDDQINYWTFDEGTGHSVNDAVGGQNGVLTGSSTGFGWAGGKIGTALGMDGGAGESVALPDGILKGSQGSVALWFKLNTLSERNVLFSGRSTTDNNIYIAITVDRDGRPQLQFRNTSTGADQKAQGATILNTNEWYHLVFTANTQTYRMYVNDQEVSVVGNNTGRWFPDLTNQTLSYRIGALDATPLSGVLDGYIDDVRIYGRALDSSDVTELYQKGNSSGPTVPLAIRPMLTFDTPTDHVPFGGSAVLEWSSQNVTSCMGSGDWNGALDLSGTRTIVKLGGDASYTITCNGKGGNVSKTVRVLIGNEASSTPKSVTPPANTVTETIITLPSSDDHRKQAIQQLIDQIMLLIAELQKQLAILKSAGH